MTEPIRIISIIRAKFPLLDTRVAELYHENEEFKLLCFDYVTSVEALESLQEKVIQQRRSIEEFKEIIKDLEKELNDYLNTK